MYDSWANFTRTGSTYSYLDYKKMQQKNSRLKVDESNADLKK